MKRIDAEYVGPRYFDRLIVSQRGEDWDEASELEKDRADLIALTSGNTNRCNIHHYRFQATGFS